MTTEIKKPIKLIAIYARVSTSHQEEQQTIKTQISAIKDFAKQNGYTIVQEYMDDGWSGDMLARPQLDQLRQDAKKKIWDGILMYDPDRLARRYSYQELVMDELREAGIEVLFVTTPAPKTGEEKILHGVKGLFAEYERAKISERFRLGKLRNIKEGHLINSEAPYGYTKIKKTEKQPGYYVINPQEAEVVKKIFTWIANERLTIRRVAKRLQELSMRPRKSKRDVWSTSTLSHLCINKTYIGEAYYYKSIAIVPENPLKTEKYRKMKKTSRRARPQEDWIKIPAPVILDRDLFMRVQQQLKENFALSDRNKKNDYLLSGKIRCVCGNTRAGEGPQHGKHLYYRCTNKVSSFPLPPSCAEKGINAKIADRLVWEELAKLMTSPKLMLKYTKQWVDSRRKKQYSSISDLESLEKKVIKLKDEEDRYNKAYGAGLISIEKLKEYSTSVRENISLLESQVIKTKTEREQANTFLPTFQEIKEFAKEAGEALQDLNFEEKRAIIRGTIEKVVGTQQELQIKGQIAINNINYVGLQTINGHSRPPKRRKIHAF
ncbi:MAG: recombinase family protein [bacterium]|nr:recombinase family protein [bacterium]